MRTLVTTSEAPPPIGPYSQGIVANGFVFASGQTPINPETGKIDSRDVAEQTEQCLKNAEAILRAAGSSIDRAVRCVVYLRSMEDFATMNMVYARFFPGERPVRTTIAVAGLPANASVEIEVTALA